MKFRALVWANRIFKRHRTPQEWGLKMLSAEPAEGRSKQVWADLARKSGPLEARGWRVDRFLNVHGAQDWPGLRVDPVVGHGLPTQRAAPLRLQGSGRAWR